MIKTHATFTYILPEDDAEGDDDAQPVSALAANADLATAIADALAGLGWSTEYRWATDYSHAFDAQRRTQRYDVMVQPVDPEARRYLLTALPRGGLFKRKAAKDPAEHETLTLDLDTVLHRTPHVSDIQWTTEADAPHKGR